MLSGSASRLKLRWHLLSLAGLLCLLPFTFVHAADVVNLTVKIVVKDGNGQPVPNASISIPRQGHNNAGTELREIKGSTNDKGEFSKDDLDFELTGTAHKLTVTAPNSTTTVEFGLPDNMLREASQRPDKLLAPNDIILSKDAPPSTNKAAISLSVVDDNGKQVPNAQVSVSYLDNKGNEVREKQEWTTDHNGTSLIEFPVTGLQYKLIVKAPGFSDGTRELSNDELRAASASKDRPYKLEIKLSQTPPSPFGEWLGNIAPYVLGTLALVFLNFLVTIIIVWAFFYWLQFHRIGSHRYKTSEVLETIFVHVEKIQNLNESIKTTHAKLDQLIAAQEKGKDEDTSDSEKPPPETEDVKPNDKPLETAVTEPTAPSGSQTITEKPDDRKTCARAALLYLDLINKTPGTPEPIYLEAEDDRTVEGKLADTNVYLSQVNHSQGSLVLFTDDDASGWVYPNPTISFIGAALKDIFPKLTRSQFDAEKENISPKTARKVSEGRWKIEASSQ